MVKSNAERQREFRERRVQQLGQLSNLAVAVESIENRLAVLEQNFKISGDVEYIHCSSKEMYDYFEVPFGNMGYTEGDQPVNGICHYDDGFWADADYDNGTGYRIQQSEDGSLLEVTHIVDYKNLRVIGFFSKFNAAVKAMLADKQAN